MTPQRTTIAAAFSIIVAVALAGCAGGGSQRPPSGLASSAALQPNAAISGSWIYQNPQANLARYRAVLLDNVTVYDGPEANFGNATPAERQHYAQLVGQELRRTMGEKIRLVNYTGPDVIRLHPILIGVRQTVGGVATVTRVIPMGIAINAVRGAAGAGGTMTGGIELAAEFYDSQTNELVAGAVRQISPGAFDIDATLSTDRTVAAAAASAGRAISEGMQRAKQKAVRQTGAQ